MFDTPHAAGSPRAPKQPFLERLAEILLIVLTFFIFGGDPPPHVNEAHYLCRLKHFWNPSFAAGDLFLESTDTQVVFIWLFGWMTRWLSLTATAWVGRVLAWLLLAWAWQRLAWRLVPRRFGAVLSAALFVTLMTVAHLAGEWVVGGVEAKVFAYGLVLVALAELIVNHWNRAWLAIGAATAFHPIVGGWSGLLCAGIWLRGSFKSRISRTGDATGGPGADNSNDRAPAERLLAMLPGMVAGGMMALVGIVPALALTWNQPPEVVAEAARIYVFERLPHHLALLALPGPELTLRIARHAILVVALFLLVRWARTMARSETNDTTLHDGVYWPRLTPLAEFAWGAVLLAIAGFVIELVFWTQPLIAAKLLRYYWFRMTDFALPMAIALYAVAVVAAGVSRQRTWAVWMLTGLLVFVGWQVSATARVRVINPVPPADRRTRDFQAWVDACEWISHNTPPEALFLTPRMSHSFKWRTGRPEVATRKDIPQDAASMIQWYDRLKSIFTVEEGSDTSWIDSPSELTTERLRQLASQYGFEYVLADRSQLLSLPVIYKNDEYVVYRLEE
jgi:hypothetical protein